MKKVILFCFMCLPFYMSAQFTDALENMVNDDRKTYEKYQELIFKATTYIFSHPVDKTSPEFKSAVQIAIYWSDKDTGWNIPIESESYVALVNNDTQGDLYIAAMVHYQLHEKIKNNRELKCAPKGESYKNQSDVKEVLLEGTKILLDYMSSDNEADINEEAQKYIEAYKKGKLEKLLFP